MEVELKKYEVGKYEVRMTNSKPLVSQALEGKKDEVRSGKVRRANDKFKAAVSLSKARRTKYEVGKYEVRKTNSKPLVTVRLSRSNVEDG